MPPITLFIKISDMKFLYAFLRTIFNNNKLQLLPVNNVSNQKRYFGKSTMIVIIVSALIIPQITSAGTSTWTGGATGTTTTKRNWNNAANWSTGIVPDATTDITIPAGLINYPILPVTISGKPLSSFLAVRNLTILSTSGTILTIPSNFTLQVAGNITTSGGLIDARSGTVYMSSSSSQNIGGSYFFSLTISNLVNDNSDIVSGLSISDGLNITNQLNLGDHSILTTNNNLVLVSTASTTAIVETVNEDPITDVPLASIIGNVTVQRYYPAHRRWRLITAPVQSSGAPTISAAWQEGGQSIAGSISNPNPGFGTDITGSGVSTTGYDQSANNSPSIAHIIGDNSWYSIPNTNSTSVTAYQGYMLFVRGDRSFPVYTGTNNTPATSTTLRTNGALNVGKVTVPVNSGFNVIGNPYAATINFNSISANNPLLSSNTFYLWDPNIGSSDNVASGTGGWVALTTDGAGGYVADPDPNLGSFPHPFDVNGDIQSGAAFVVEPLASSGSIVIDEGDKISDLTDNDNYLFRPTINTTTATNISTLRTTLYSADTANTYLADGALNMFSSSYTNDVNWNKDVKKQFSFNERLFILKDSQSIAIEKSALPQAGDTVHLNIGSLKVAPYQLVIATKNFARPDINAFLIDSFTNSSTPILLGDTAVTVNFAVTAAPASSAANRFSVVFTAAPVAPIVTTTQSSLIKVYPNPVTNGTANIDLANLPSGNYKIRVISQTGKVVLDESIYHGLNDGPIPVSLGKNVSAGIYIIQIIAPNGNKTKINIEKQ
jgi:hypothetical protein